MGVVWLHRSGGGPGRATLNEPCHRLETFPKRLNAAGDGTAFIGNWYMGNDDSRAVPSPVPIFDGNDPDRRSSFLVAYWSGTVFEHIDHTGYNAVRTDHYKLIRYEDQEGMDGL
jgi:hypothetical protein